MARETKVGLLAGLAFIICFAVILANRGRQSPTDLHQPYLVDAGIKPKTNTRPQRTFNIWGSDKKATGKTTQQPSTQMARQISRRSDVRNDSTESAPSSGSSLFPFLKKKATNFGVANRNGAPPSTQGRVLQDDSPTLAAETIPVGRDDFHNPPPTLQEQQQVLEERLQRLSDGRNHSLRTTQGGQASLRRTDPAPMNQRRSTVHTKKKPGPFDNPKALQARYIVGPGDSLTRIANRHYGNSSANVIKAIFQANRSALAHPDKLKVGMKLILPAINGLGRPHKASAFNTKSKQGTRRVATSGKRRYHWYQIKLNDRYISIARDQLGDENRWREIYDLNKDKFPDPSRIREGVRIKLPVVSVVDSRVRKP